MTNQDNFREGIRLFRTQDLVGAASQFRAATKENPGDHKAWNALGVCYGRLGSPGEADLCFEEALRLDSENTRYAKNRMLNARKLQEALDSSATTFSELVLADDAPGEELLPVRYSNRMVLLLSLLSLFAGTGMVLVYLLPGHEDLPGLFTSSECVILLFFCIFGFLLSLIRHTRYAFPLLFLIGGGLLLAPSGFGIIPGVLLLISGFLLSRETGFEFQYYLNLHQDRMNKVLFSLLFVGIFLLVVTAVYTSFGSSPEGDQITPADIPVETGNVTVIKGLEISDLAFTSDGHYRYVSGEVRNTETKRYSFLQIEINLYDESGDLTGTTYANKNRLGAYEVWKFQTLMVDDAATRCGVRGMTAY